MIQSCFEGGQSGKVDSFSVQDTGCSSTSINGLLGDPWNIDELEAVQLEWNSS